MFWSPMASVDFAQHTWSERSRDDGASRIKKNTICNAEFFTKVPKCLELMVWELLSRWPTVEGVMLQQLHVWAWWRSIVKLLANGIGEGRRTPVRAGEVRSKWARWTWNTWMLSGFVLTCGSGLERTFSVHNSKVVTFRKSVIFCRCLGAEARSILKIGWSGWWSIRTVC